MHEKWHKLSIDETVKILETNKKGLTENEALSRFKNYGPNEIKEKRTINPFSIFLKQFRSFLVIILLVAVIFSAIIGHFIDAAVIIVIVIANAILGFIQEYKAEKAIESLKKLTSPETLVIRNGKEKKIPNRLLVPGDVVILEEGCKIPADLRLMEVINLKIDESTLTGESFPVLKNIEILGDAVLAERKNMVHMGTSVTSGRGKAIVVQTGMKTEIGKIAKMIQEAPEEETPLQEKLNVFGKNLGILILAICTIIVLIGVIRGSPVLDMIITGIALAVAAIPEGLPAVVTITLALGLQKMSKENALVRTLPSIETLGCTTVICADKTGTLTRNEMTVKKIWCNDETINVTGKGYEIKGSFHIGNKKLDNKDDTLLMLLKTACLCNNAKWDDNQILGDPTEGALLVAAKKTLDIDEIRRIYKRIDEIPFSSERKMMSTIHLTPKGKKEMHVKGAPETILEKCTKIYKNGRIRTLTKQDKEHILSVNHDLTNDALRVLGIAYSEVPTGKYEKYKKLDNFAYLEEDLIFIGLMGMIDPARFGVKEDISLCKKAGIKVIMITGDHKNTAEAIAKELGIITGNERIINGSELEKINDNELEKIVEDIHVYARVNPSDKVRIVKALKKKGHVVAMTGDGVNDAPALKLADIGIAMGIKGTDVAKEASDMILRDDNFSSIVSAMKSGRTIYDNIKKFVQYLLSTNLGEVLVIFIAILIGFTNPETGSIILPLTAAQLLWINLLTDGLPALALGTDPPSPDVMERKPRKSEEKILSKGMLTDIFIVGILMCIGILFLFSFNLESGVNKAVTVAFTTMVMFEMVRVYSVRIKYKIGAFSNKNLIYAVIFSIFLQLIVVYTPFLQPLFSTVPLGLLEWGQILLVSFILMIILWVKEKSRK